MKRLYLLALLNLVSGALYAQLFQQQWVGCKDEPNALINTTHMTTDRFGNTYMAGTEKDIFEPEFPPHMFILKFDASGNFAWKKYFNQLKDSSDDVQGIATDAQGNIYLTGSRMQVGGCDVCPDFLVKDIVTTKYAPNGDILWRRRYVAGDYKLGIPSDIRVTTNGYCLVTGYYKQYNTIFSTFDYTMKVLAYGPAGNLIASKSQPGVIGLSGCFDRKLNLIVAGEEIVSNVTKPVVVKFNKRVDLQWKAILDEPNRKGSFYHVYTDDVGSVYANGQANAISFAQPNIVTVKYDANGTQAWKRSEINRTFTGKGTFGDYEVDTEGNSYICGYQDYGSTDRDWLTIRYDRNGIKKWSRVFADPIMFGNYPQDIELTKDGRLLVAGNGIPAPPFVYAYNTIMYDTAGNQLWQAYYKVSTNGNSLAVGARMDAAGNIYTGGSGVCVVKYQPNTSSAAMLHAASSWSISPNPTASHINVTGIDLSQYKINNTLGVLIKAGKLNSGIVAQSVDVSTLKPGIYFMHVHSKNGWLKQTFQKL